MTSSNSASSTPTVVLAHGAFADASGWAGVVERLMAADVPVRAVVNPLRGISADSAYVASVIRQIPGPVLAVGHSYGGAVITNAASMAGNVVGLVYVAAFAPDEGESLQEIEGGSRDSVLPAALRQTDYPVGSSPEVLGELSIDVALFHGAVHGPAGGRGDHRGRRVPRADDVPAGRGHRRDPQGREGSGYGRLTARSRISRLGRTRH
jgi:pimeloyl-ACP methyl ester carboxylesterase